MCLIRSWLTSSKLAANNGPRVNGGTGETYIRYNWLQLGELWGPSCLLYHRGPQPKIFIWHIYDKIHGFAKPVNLTMFVIASMNDCQYTFPFHGVPCTPALLILVSGQFSLSIGCFGVIF